MEAMVFIPSRFGFYHGPYVNTAPAIIHTDYVGPVTYVSIRNLMLERLVIQPDFEVLWDDIDGNERVIKMILMYPGMVFHGRN